MVHGNKFRGVWVIAFLGVMVFCCYPGLLVNFSTHVIRGNMGDLHNMLGIISHSLHSSPDQIYHLPVFYPQAFVLTHTHPLFGVSIVYWIFHLLGLSLVQSTNLYIILSLLLGAWGTYLLAREFTTKSFFPLLFSTLYIFHPLNHLHFVWLNFLSRFYLPFVLLFLVRYFKTRKKYYALAAAAMAFMQFLASVYYGVLLWALLIPFFLLMALLFKQVTLKQLAFPILCLGIGGLLIIFIFYPYLAHNAGAVKHFDHKLTQVEELFSVSRVLSAFMGQPENLRQYLFPGFLFSAAFLIYFAFHDKRRRISWISMSISLLVLICVLVYFNRPLANYIFILLIILLIYLTVTQWKQIPPWPRIFLLTLGFMFIMLFHFTHPAIFKTLAPYRLFYSLLPVGGLTVIKRTFLWLLPLFTIFAAAGAARLFPSVEQWKPAKRQTIFLVLLLLLALENVRGPMLYLPGDSGVMKPLPPKATAYEHIPYDSNSVVLEIPFYFRRRLKNAQYMVSRRFHQNPILNGKITLLPQQYYYALSQILGKFQQDFPTQTALQKLIQNYNVSYIVIHWELLKDYQDIRHAHVPRDQIRQQFLHLPRYAQIIYQDNTHMVVRLQENFPQKQIIRTYSYYHLRRAPLKIRLKQPYNGSVDVQLNGKPIKTIPLDSSEISIDLRNAALKHDANKVILRFESGVVNLHTAGNRKGCPYEFPLGVGYR